MTTTITPQSGSAPLYTQQGVGTTPGYSALDTQRASLGALQEGVYGTASQITAGGVANVPAADFMVTQRGAGANMSVDINMPAGGFAYVQGDTIGGQGLYVVPVHSATINEPLAPADPTNPRVDTVILEVLDNVLDGSGNNLARVRVLTGNPTSGATLSNRSGATALPGSALLLGDVLVAALATSVANSAIRDRRKWARGAYVRIVRTSNASAGNDYTTTSSGFAAVDAVNLAPRVECGGLPVRVALRGQFYETTIGYALAIKLTLDGSDLDGMLSRSVYPAVANAGYLFCVDWECLPAAGSHIFGVSFALGSGGSSGSLQARSTVPLEMTVDESVTTSSANASVTSG